MAENTHFKWTLLRKEIFLVVSRVTASPVIVLKVSSQHVVVRLGSEYPGPGVAPPVRKPFTQLDEVVHHFRGHVGSQLKDNSKSIVIVNLNL